MFEACILNLLYSALFLGNSLGIQLLFLLLWILKICIIRKANEISEPANSTAFLMKLHSRKRDMFSVNIIDLL